MPMIATTIISSISVKPCCFFMKNSKEFEWWMHQERLPVRVFVEHGSCATDRQRDREL